MMTGDDNPPKMIGTKQHRVMTPNMDLSSVKKELLRQVKLSSEDIFIDEVVSAPPPCAQQCLRACYVLAGSEHRLARADVDPHPFPFSFICSLPSVL